MTYILKVIPTTTLFNGLILEISMRSNKATEAAMEVGAEFIGMVNKNTKGLCKETIENLTKDWP